MGERKKKLWKNETNFLISGLLHANRPRLTFSLAKTKIIWNLFITTGDSRLVWDFAWRDWWLTASEGQGNVHQTWRSSFLHTSVTERPKAAQGAGSLFRDDWKIRGCNQWVCVCLQFGPLLSRPQAEEHEPHFSPAAPPFQRFSRAIAFTFRLRPLTRANLSSQRKLKSLGDSTSSPSLRGVKWSHTGFYLGWKKAR